MLLEAYEPAPVAPVEFPNHKTYCFHRLGVLFAGVLILRALLLGRYFRAPDVWWSPRGEPLMAIGSSGRLLCSFFLAMTCFFLLGTVVYYSKRNYIGVARLRG